MKPLDKKKPWFRFYAETISNPKAQRLPGDIFKTWVNLLCLASNGGGGLPPMEDIVHYLHLPEKTVRSHLSKLVAARLIDVTQDGDDVILKPHNWDQRQFNSDCSTARVKRFRAKAEKDVDAAAAVSETFQNGSAKRPRSVSVSDSDSVSEILSIQDKILSEDSDRREVAK